MYTLPDAVASGLWWSDDSMANWSICVELQKMSVQLTNHPKNYT